MRLHDIFHRVKQFNPIPCNKSNFMLACLLEEIHPRDNKGGVLRFGVIALVLVGCSEYNLGNVPPSSEQIHAPDDEAVETPDDDEYVGESDWDEPPDDSGCWFPVQVPNGITVYMENELLIEVNPNTPFGDVEASPASEVFRFDITALHEDCPDVILDGLSWGFTEDGASILHRGGTVKMVNLTIGFMHMQVDDLYYDTGRIWFFTHNVLEAGDTYTFSVQFDFTYLDYGPLPYVEFYVFEDSLSWSSGLSEIDPVGNQAVWGEEVRLVWP